MQVIDLSFPVIARDLPIDHGYALYSAISRIVPQLHDRLSVGIHPIRGQAGQDGLLLLPKTAELRIRLEAGLIPAFLPLTGKGIDICGHLLRLGVPQVMAIRPAECLFSRIVTIKGFMEPDAFLSAARRQLDKLTVGPEASMTIPIVSDEGKIARQARRVLAIKDKTIVGFSLRVKGLAPEESLRIQEKGIGGRRHMGCGVFVPSGGKGEA